MAHMTAGQVHKHLKDNPDRALEADNLESVCAACHNQLHPEKAGGKARRKRKAQ
ncbi:hypothetical protein [Desmospora profundinema]|uniref:HNH domain-containing protein n=1 Tax=Desmospora profundinema TaxID=1571184 RepID=A0ABU1IUX9_9BACL|nr:hypothetical protein [Desmospora profundinema]MDR6227560.1 hypothetical protein [Desmospora profundinema]